MKNKNILVVIQDYQKNHEVFYDVLINQVFANANVNVLCCNYSKVAIETSGRVKVHYCKDDKQLRYFFKHNKALFKHADLIIFEELYTFHLTTLTKIITYGHKSLQIIHNSNKFLNRKLKLNLKSIIAYVFFKKIKNSVAGIIVISQTIKEYITKQKLFNSNNVFYIPFNDTTKEYTSRIGANNKIKFTIPGTVNTERRNYKIFLVVFLKILQGNPGAKIKLCLLGKIIKLGREEQELINELKKINPEVIDTWHEFIDDKTYHEELLTTNYLIGNINTNYVENNVKEVYGISKETGVLFLMLQYKLPTLFPTDYFYSKLYESYIINYKNNADSLHNTIFELLKTNTNKKEIKLDTHNDYVKKEIEKIYNIFLSA